MGPMTDLNRALERLSRIKPSLDEDGELDHNSDMVAQARALIYSAKSKMLKNVANLEEQ